MSFLTLGLPPEDAEHLSEFNEAVKQAQEVEHSQQVFAMSHLLTVLSPGGRRWFALPLTLGTVASLARWVWLSVLAGYTLQATDAGHHTLYWFLCVATCVFAAHGLFKRIQTAEEHYVLLRGALAPDFKGYCLCSEHLRATVGEADEATDDEEDEEEAVPRELLSDILFDGMVAELHRMPEADRAAFVGALRRFLAELDSPGVTDDDSVH